jgi:hypothetical protein
VCGCCRDIVYAAETNSTYDTCEVGLSEVQSSAASCSVCAVLLVALQHCDTDDGGKILLRRTRFGLIAEVRDLRLLRFSVDPGE